MSNVYKLFSGLIIGIGVILPGVSGSVIAILLGIYDKIIYILNDSRKKLVDKIKELFPILIGIMFGVMLFGNILLILIKRYEIEVKYLFIGLILGGVPILKQEIEIKEKSKINYKYTIITLIISLVLFISSDFNVINLEYSSNSFIKMLVAGFLYISGKIIPGISSSFFLMVLGLYDYILNIMSNPFLLTVIDLIQLIPFIIGVIIGFIILIKIINKLLSNYFVKTYSAIIGFILGSIIAIYPGFEFNIKYILSILIMIISFIIVYKMGQKR